jgi:hypothetical protein
VKIYFDVPYGYHQESLDIDSTLSIPRKGDFVKVYQRKWHSCAELRVQKVCFDYDSKLVKVVLVEED